MLDKENKKAWIKKYNKLPHRIEINKKYKREYRKRNPEAFKNLVIKKVYGITIEDYKRMFEEQKGCCKICNIHHSVSILNIDHNHSTGKVRGLLCTKCNTRLGHFENFINNKELTESFKIYLKIDNNL